MSTDTIDQATETQDEQTEISPVIKVRLEHLERIQDSQADVDALARALDDAKATLKEAKASWEHAVDRHGSIVRQNPDQLELDFRGDQDSKATDWRTIPLEEVAGITAAQLKAMSNHSPRILTVGELADWTAEATKEVFSWWKDIAGLGDAGAENVDESMANFWTTHPEHCVDEADEDDQAEDEDGCNDDNPR